MSRSYMFTQRGTNAVKANVHVTRELAHEDIVELDDVDKFVAAWWNEPYSKDRYCPHFDMLVEVGFVTLLSEGGGYIGEEGVRPARRNYSLGMDEEERPRDHLAYLMRVSWLKRMEGEDDLHYEAKNEQFKAFLYYMFFVKYHFHAWG